MEKKNFHRTIKVNASAEEAMKKISQINLWWVEDFSGKTEKLNDLACSLPVSIFHFIN